MASFAYVAPTSIEEVARILGEHQGSGKRAQVLAGGTDLLVQMRSADVEPRTIVDIKKVEDANRLDFAADNTFIGAAIPCAVLDENTQLKGLFPGLVEAAELIGSTQIQGRATLGGNFCNSSPAADTTPAIIADRGVAVVAGTSGRREVDAHEFTTGVGTNVLRSDEFVIGLRFPNPGPRTSDAYLRFIPRTEMDIAVAGCGVSITLDADGVCTAARVVIGAVAPTARLVPEAGTALVGSKLDAAALERAGIACSNAASPISDKRGTVEYRRKVVAVLCRRAATIVQQRIQD